MQALNCREPLTWTPPAGPPGPAPRQRPGRTLPGSVVASRRHQFL